MTKPHPHNFCGGNYQDWREGMLLPNCNGKCEWCVEKFGWHPKEKVHWTEIVNAVVSTGKKNVILLGGEPTLHKDLGNVISGLWQRGRKIYVTTNGSRLHEKFICENNLQLLTGVNISIHDYHLMRNQTITGISLSRTQLFSAIEVLKERDCKVRFNCNLIDGHIDSVEEIENYINWAKKIGADSVRFAELKYDTENFVDLYKLFGNTHGLNDDPYLYGCNNNVEINGMHVNFRQMCGLQTSLRPPHPDFQKYPKQVLYYDGKIYDGWQVTSEQKEHEMDRSKIAKVLRKFKDGKVDEETVLDLIEVYVDGAAPQAVVPSQLPLRIPASGPKVGSGCTY